MIEKQQRAVLKSTGKEKPVMEILRESAAKNFAPLLRGTVPLMGHSFASAVLGLVGQPQLQKWIQQEMGAKTTLGGSATNFVASAIVSPIYGARLARARVARPARLREAGAVARCAPPPPAPLHPRPVIVTNPLSRLEVIMQTNSIKGRSIGVVEAVREMGSDMAAFGLRGLFRGQGLGIAKAIVSLSLFHEGRMFVARQIKANNESNGRVYVEK